MEVIFCWYGLIFGPLSVWMANKIIDEIKSVYNNPDVVVISPKIRPYQQ